MSASPFPFVDAVVSGRDLLVTEVDRHTCRIEPRRSDLAWHCDLDDGTPTGENDPASSVRWVCPSLRTRGPRGRDESGLPPLVVRRTAPGSDLGRLWRRLIGPRDASGAEETYAWTDPAGVLDPALRERLEHWPAAPHGDGVVRPAELWSIDRTREGLVVLSVSWWDGADALDHQIGVALDVAHRLAAA